MLTRAFGTGHLPVEQAPSPASIDFTIVQVPVRLTLDRPRPPGRHGLQVEQLTSQVTDQPIRVVRLEDHLHHVSDPRSTSATNSAVGVEPLLTEHHWVIVAV